MRLHRRAPFAHVLLLASATAVFSLAAAEHAAAQFRGGMGGPMAMPRAGMTPNAMPRAPMAPSVGAMPRAGGGLPSAMPRGSLVTRFPGKIMPWPNTAAGKGHPPRRPDGSVVGGKKPSQSTTRPSRRHPPRGPVIVGPAIGTGVLIGTAGAAAAAVPPSGSPPPSSSGPSAPPPAATGNANINIPPQNERRFVPNEVLIEFAGNYPAQAMAALARRHRLARIDSINLSNTNSTYFHGRITGRRTVRAVLAGLRNETALRAAQPNYIYTAAQAARAAHGGDPAQYALAKLRLQEAHSLTRGNDILVAVIDSGIDTAHPELQGVIAGTFDALKKAGRPHAHGTAMAGTIAARSRLTGVAPAARILAIRAFGATGSSAEATTAAVLRGVDHAIGRDARVINMSFAGPSDPGLGRSLAAARAKGIVLVAAAGNLGEKSPPQYPAADPNVIAVTATDADDRLYSGANRGSHIAVAAPGVDIVVPAPNAAYDITTGTSVAAAHVSGVVALILERKPDADPETVRAILQSSAKDLGPSGKDEQFGAGLTDAYQAVLALEPPRAAAETVGQAGR